MGLRSMPTSSVHWPVSLPYQQKPKEEQAQGDRLKEKETKEREMGKKLMLLPS